MRACEPCAGGHPLLSPVVVEKVPCYAQVFPSYQEFVNKLVQLADDLLQHLNLFLGIANGLQTLIEAGSRMDDGRMVANEF